jgi:hypothetical protein
VPYATPDIWPAGRGSPAADGVRKRAYTVLPLAELVARTQRGVALPPRALAITFDDGYATTIASRSGPARARSSRDDLRDDRQRRRRPPL